MNEWINEQGIPRTAHLPSKSVNLSLPITLQFLFLLEIIYLVMINVKLVDTSSQGLVISVDERWELINVADSVNWSFLDFFTASELF